MQANHAERAAQASVVRRPDNLVQGLMDLKLGLAGSLLGS